MAPHLGYEEAAAQGLLAGINAARRAQEVEPVVLPRESSYLGTLVDDLVTKVRTQGGHGPQGGAAGGQVGGGVVGRGAGARDGGGAQGSRGVGGMGRERGCSGQQEEQGTGSWGSSKHSCAGSATCCCSTLMCRCLLLTTQHCTCCALVGPRRRCSHT
jgi:hypothetical protein